MPNRLADAKPGDQIIVYINPMGELDFSCQTHSRKIPATVLYQLDTRATVLAWKDGEIFIKERDYNCHYQLSSIDLNQGFVVAKQYNNRVHCELITGQKATVSESSCRNCTKQNDLNVAKCWWCECPNPTA